MSNPVYGNQSFSNISNIASTDINKILASDITASKIRSSNIGLSTGYISYNGANPFSAQISLGTAITFITNTTTNVSNNAQISLPTGEFEGQIIYIAPTNQYAKYDVIGSNFYLTYLDNTYPYSFVWSEKLKLWIGLSAY